MIVRLETMPSAAKKIATESVQVSFCSISNTATMEIAKLTVEKYIRISAPVTGLQP